ncbi:tetratricopeptide repeat-containing sensor histidine kinase [Parabacteroides sp. OttesenSCG-928-G07]|nr:tetratricopeptide repeat-containing sensor histidine kinase [Parabacteroides sp. OttesenSCG-928-G21]MDL2278589.1 tetratricopeptide repeat-containing sensor histidine kinase [Parabacteroides sp. OttesenSCG-928-G07]
MEAKKPDKKDIISLAKKTKHYCDLLIEQSENWLSEEEGARNVEKRLDESSGKERKIGKFLRNKGAKVVIGVLVSLTFSSIALGQDVDSLFVLFAESSGGRQLELANRIAEGFMRQGAISAEQLFTPSDNPKEIAAFIYANMGSYHSLKGQYEEAIPLYETGISLYREVKDSLNICKYLQNLYVARSVTGDYRSAFPCLEESYEIALSLKHDGYIAYGTLTMGDFYYRNKHYELAETYFRDALEKYKLLDNAQMAIATIERLSLIYWELDEKEEVVKLIEELAYWKTKELRPMSKFTVYMIEAQIYKEPGQWNRAIAYLDSCLVISDSLELVDYSLGALTQKSEICLMSGQVELAEEALVRAKELCVAYDRFTVLQLVYRQLYSLHKAGNPAQALAYLEEYTFMNDSLYEKQMQEQLANFHVQYDTAEKESLILLQQAELKSRSLQRTILGIGFLLSVLILLLLMYTLNLRTKRNRVLAEMNATKDQFFSIISHDLKNPAIAQREALQMLIEYSREWDTEALSSYYGELLKSADSQVELLYNLLNWAQVQTGRMPYCPITFDVASELASDISLLTNMAKSKGVCLKVEIPENTIVCADRNMLATVVRNLLTNAVKFTEKGGTVCLQVEREADGYTFIVGDTGIGMSAEQLRNLFVIGRRRSRKGTSGEQGNGLGLVVCKELVEKHGGRLQAESVEGEGSVFRFTIRG